MTETMNRTFSAEEAEVLGRRAVELGESAEALSLFAQESPELAQLAGVEVAALEARSILRSGAIHRVVATAMGSARIRRQAQIAAPDLESMTRLEAVVQLSGARINASVQSMDQQGSRGRFDTLGSIIGLASTAVGLYKALF